MKKIKENDIVSIFDDVLKENRLTKKVLLGTRREPMTLFGKYHEVEFSLMSGLAEINIISEKFKETSLNIPSSIKSLGNFRKERYTAFKLYQTEENNRGEFELYVYNEYPFKKYDFLENNKPFIIKVKIGNQEVLLENENTIAKY